MGKTEKMLTNLGGSIEESLGIRESKSDPKKEEQSKTVTPNTGLMRSRNIGEMEIDRIVTDEQPRGEFDTEELQRLADSIKRHGQLSPIRVQWHKEKRVWVVVFGERRLRACKLAGLHRVRCEFIEKEVSASQRLEEQIVENLHRADLTPIEQAKGYQQLMDMNQWNAKQLGEHLHISKGTLSRCLALLKLPEDVQLRVHEGDIPPSSAYEISKVKKQEDQREMAEEVTKGKATHADTKETAKKKTRPKAKSPVALKPKKYRASNGLRIETFPTKKMTLKDVKDGLLEIAGGILIEQATPQKKDELESADSEAGQKRVA